jgi:hypothetical protein
MRSRLGAAVVGQAIQKGEPLTALDKTKKRVPVVIGWWVHVLRRGVVRLQRRLKLGGGLGDSRCQVSKFSKIAFVVCKVRPIVGRKVSRIAFIVC